MWKKLPNRVLVWQAFSPDLNLNIVENARANSNAASTAATPGPHVDMERVVKQEWASLPMTGYMDSLFSSMETRLRAVVAGDAEFTPY